MSTKRPSSAKVFLAALWNSGFYSFLGWAVFFWGTPSALAVWSLNAWIAVTALVFGGIAVYVIGHYINFCIVDRKLASLYSELEARRAPRNATADAPDEPLEKCYRCMNEPTNREGKHLDPHYSNGVCIICDGTGLVNPSRFKKI